MDCWILGESILKNYIHSCILFFFYYYYYSRIKSQNIQMCGKSQVISLLEKAYLIKPFFLYI